MSYSWEGNRRSGITLAMSHRLATTLLRHAAGSRLWNTLPAHLRQCDSLRQFKRDCLRLISLVSSLWFLRPRRSVTSLLGAPCINLLTYLLKWFIHVQTRGFRKGYEHLSYTINSGDVISQCEFVVVLGYGQRRVEATRRVVSGC